MRKRPQGRTRWQFIGRQKQLDMAHQEAYETILAHLESMDGHLGSIVISYDGEIRASRLDRVQSPDKIVAMAVEMANICSQTAPESQFGRADIMVVEGEEGKIAAMNVPQETGYIVLLGDPEMNLAMARLRLNKTTSGIEEKFSA